MNVKVLHAFCNAAGEHYLNYLYDYPVVEFYDIVFLILFEIIKLCFLYIKNLSFFFIYLCLKDQLDFHSCSVYKRKERGKKAKIKTGDAKIE